MIGNFMRIGEYKFHKTGSESYRSYVPIKLPIEVHVDQRLIEKASSVLAELGSLSVPSLDLFLYMYVRKEAVLSSQIEGTQSSLNDLILFENNQRPGTKISDVREVSRYVEALNYGIERINSGFPLCLRLLREIHSILLHNTRGQEYLPGEFRTSQNWIGGTRPGNAAFVPPEPQILDEYLTNLERYINNEKSPVILRAAIAHVQFETIHPFLDGNGRMGRLLIILILFKYGMLKTPLLYISLYFKERRFEYYKLLNDVREKGNWEDWINFFFNGVISVSKQAISVIKKATLFFDKCEEIIAKMGRQRFSAKLLFEYLKRHPITFAPDAANSLKTSVPTARSALESLAKQDIISVKNIDRKQKIYTFQKYLDLLEKVD